MTTEENIVAAKALILRGWSKYASARTVDGSTCEPRDRNACQWCLRGALVAASRDTSHYNAITRVRGVILQVARDRMKAAKQGAMPATVVGTLVAFNDHPDTVLADVLAVLDMALETKHVTA